jgi:hypothetical protein
MFVDKECTGKKCGVTSYDEPEMENEAVSAPTRRIKL